MTPLMLQKSLINFLQKKVANEIKVKFVDKKNVTHEINPTVISGFLIPKSQNSTNSDTIDNKEYAHIATRLTKIDDNLKNVIVEMKIIIGIQSYDSAHENCVGYIEVCNLIEKTRQELLKQSVIDKKFIVSKEIKSKIYEEQYYPYWLGEIITTWILPVMGQEGINFDN